MTTNPNPMFLEQMPFSREHARSMFGGTDPKKLALLIPNLFTDYAVIITEFDKTIQTAEWTVPVSAGGTAFAYSATRGGTAQGQTGATDNDVVAIHRAQTFLDAGHHGSSCSGVGGLCFPVDMDGRAFRRHKGNIPW